MVMHYSAKLRYNKWWLQNQHERNTRRSNTLRKAFRAAMKGLRRAGIDYHPHRGDRHIPRDGEGLRLARAAKLAWSKLRTEERNLREWHILLDGAAKRMDDSVHADLNVLLAARARHCEHLLRSRVHKPRWDVLDKPTLAKVRWQPKAKKNYLSRLRARIPQPPFFNRRPGIGVLTL